MAERPPLHLTLYTAKPGVWGARGELATAHGPIVICIEAPADFVTKYIHAQMGKATISGEDDFGGFLSSLKKRVTAAQRFAAKAVVQQAINVSRAALPSQALKIAQSVAEKTGIAPKGSTIGKAFTIASKALSGDVAAKKFLLKLNRAAGLGNPKARALLTTIMETSKLLPNVLPITQAAQAGLALAQGQTPPQVQAALALARGDARGAVAALAPQAALLGNPAAALAPWLKPRAA